MKRASTVTALLAMGLLVASSFASAQDKPAASTAGGEVTLGLLGRSDVGSSKFTEYREVPKGLSIPYMNLFATNSMVDFNLDASKVRQSDQRYSGWANTAWFGLAFDYNQIPHNMGNDAQVIWSETGQGVWSMSSTLRQGLASAADSTASAGRTYPFYLGLLTPTFNAANHVDISSLRQRGTFDFDLGKKLPFDLSFTYMRELKTGFRGQGGGDIVGSISPVVDVPETLNETVQDYGVRAAYNFKGTALAGNVHGTFNRNLYTNDAATMAVDNPFRPVDVAYTTSTSNPGGGAGTIVFTNPPDNAANMGLFGFLFKFKKQTRVAGDVALASWTQNAAFSPYTSNSTILTGTGLPANQVSSLQEPSLNGKINTTTLNFSFSSRPVEGLGVRMRYRSYDLTNKTTKWVITGDTSGSPDRSWGAADPATTDEPYGHATANMYDTTNHRFDVGGNYDYKSLTFDAAYRYTSLSRTYREATSGKEDGFVLSAVYHANDLLGLRVFYDYAHRTAEGEPLAAFQTVDPGRETVYGFQSDEAERTTKRTGFNVELSPGMGLDLTFAYFRRNVDYPNRPNRIPLSSGVPVAGAAPIPDTPSGLLSANYDTFTAEVEYAPNARIELGAYYTYEKDATTNQWSTTTGTALNNKLNYAGTDKTNTFGVNATFQLVPDKWSFYFMARSQKVDGLMDVTALETGSFYTPGRTTLIPAGQGGAADILDWDDTTLTTIVAQLDYNIAKAWKMAFGYAYEKYDFKDAYTSGTTMLPQSVLIFMKPNYGPYNANVVYSKLTYRF
jgi:hypothetical protein